MNLSLWQNFYVIAGSSAGALISVQFVVIALISSLRRRAEVESINAFGTPTVVHFGGALTISALMTAPWPSLLALSVTLTICGLLGLVYSSIVFRRARRQTAYRPVPEDWLWYVGMPTGIYAALTVVAVFLRDSGRVGLFLIAAAVLGLLLIGIRNAWDSVTHLVAGGHQSDGKTSE